MKQRTKIAMGIAGIAIIAAGIIWSRLKQPDEDLRTFTVGRRIVTQEVTFTGKLQTVQHAELGFQTAGTIADIPVTIGQSVQSGEVLLQLDSRAASLERSRAYADRVSQEQQTYIAWQNAENEWNNTKTLSAQSIEKQKQVVRDARLELDQAQAVWSASADENGEESAAAQAAYAAFVAKRSLYNAAQKTLTELQQSAKNSAASTRAAADIAREQHVSSKQAAGNVAGLSSLAALEQLASVQLSLNTIRAPFDGVITDIVPSIGEYAAPGVPQIKIESADQLEVMSNVTEVDAAKLTVGLPAQVTFDVFPTEDGVPGKVSSIAPIAELIEGVPTYKVTIQLLGSDKRLKPGFTANATIIADERRDVLTVPRRSVITKNDLSFVRVIGEDGFVAEHPIKAGLFGSDGQIEVVVGLQEGMRVITNPSQEENSGAD